MSQTKTGARCRSQAVCLRASCFCCLIVAGNLGHLNVSMAEEARVDSARSVVEEILERGSIPGLSAAVARDGKIVWSESFGSADIDSVPATAQANRIANIFSGLDPGPKIKGLAERRARTRAVVGAFRKALEAWGTSLEGGHLDRHMDVYSHAFKSQRWQDKKEMRNYWESALSQHTVEIDTVDAHVQIGGFDYGSQVWVSGLKVEWSSESVPIVVTFAREMDGWKATEISVIAERPAK